MVQKRYSYNLKNPPGCNPNSSDVIFTHRLYYMEMYYYSYGKTYE